MSTSDSFGLFGKLPFRDDFVRVFAAGEPFGSFDDWLVTGIEWANARAGDGWHAALAAGGVYAFVFRPPHTATRGPLLVGAIAPSADRAGRQFPLMVGQAFVADAALLATPEVLPIVMEEAWQVATDFVARDPNTLASDLAQQLESLRAHAAPASDALATYREWLEELPVAEFWTLLYGADYGEQPLLLLRMLVEAIRPQRGIERPSTPLTLRLPLGRAAGAAVCFWIDLTRRLLEWRETIPSFFWSHDGSSGQMLLHLGTPPRSTCAELWQPGPARDEVCDLTAKLDEADAVSLPALPAALASSALSDHHRLSELVEHARAG